MSGTLGTSGSASLDTCSPSLPWLTLYAPSRMRCFEHAKRLFSACIKIVCGWFVQNRRLLGELFSLFSGCLSGLQGRVTLCLRTQPPPAPPPVCQFYSFNLWRWLWGCFCGKSLMIFQASIWFVRSTGYYCKIFAKFEVIKNKQKLVFNHSHKNCFRQESSVDAKTRKWKYDEKQDVYMVSKHLPIRC